MITDIKKGSVRFFETIRRVRGGHAATCNILIELVFGSTEGVIVNGGEVEKAGMMGNMAGKDILFVIERISRN